MRLPVSTWPDIERWLKKSKTIVMPIGSMEQHGPNGFIGTDALCPEIIANHAESLAPDDLLIGPTFNVGCAQHHLGFPGTIMDLTIDHWNKMIAVNLTGVMLGCQAAIRAISETGGSGAIVNVSSMAATLGGRLGSSAYAASKGAVVQLAKSLAIAWARDNIQVNAILPGWLVTDMVADTKAKVPGFDEAIVARTPARRWGEPDDLAGTAVYLCSRASDFVTGAAIAVDGGYAVM